MALTSARQILNKKILGTGGGVPSADEIPIDIAGLSATKLSVGLEEIVLDIDQLSSSVLTINEKIDNMTDWESEHKIGKWIDGSDLYEQVVNIPPTGIQAGDDVSIAHGVSGIDKICEFQGYGRVGNGVYTNYSYPGYYLDVHEVSRTTSLWRIGSSILEQVSQFVLVLRYTKLAPTESKKKTTKKK